MMKKIKLFVLIALVISTCVFGVAKAQSEIPALPQEAIVSYSSAIAVNVDNSIDVVETITYNTGPQEHHGIYRDIYPYSSQNRKMIVSSVSVTDENGTAYSFQISSVNGNTRIKIGDPNQTFSGQKIYVIKYHATRAVAQLQGVDEIYWNVTGNDWGMPIYKTDASVVLPHGATMVQSACYYGPKGSTSQCSAGSSTNGTYTFSTPSKLNPRDGLTIAVGFPKGVVTPYSSSDAASNFFDTYKDWLIAALLPLLTLILSLLYWYKKGRDPKGKGVIIPEYDVPDNLSPMEVAGIANEKISANSISAEIIYLATKGYVKIRQLEESFIGFIKWNDYELTKLKSFSDLPNDFDKVLLNSLFDAPSRPKMSDIKNLFIKKTAPAEVPVSESQNQSIKLSDLRNVFYKTTPLIINSALDGLVSKGYYKNLGPMKSGMGSRAATVAFMSVWASLFFGGFIGTLAFKGDPFPMIAGIFLSCVIYGIISHFNPAKTEKGVATKEYILGLKEYLQIAEKDRLQFHNAPEKKPEIFEKFLPYAMVLGVTSIWAKEFEGIYTTPPSWYSGLPNNAFGPTAFTHSLNNFSSFASTSMTSSPGGSGGGGSSGGGGGGGGGGSW